jgi:hypothetical protein
MKLKKQSEANGVSFNGLATKKLLPQYDEEDEEVTEKRKNRIVLATANRSGDTGDEDDFMGEGYGVTASTKEQKMAELREKLSGKSKQKISLEVSKVNTIFSFLSFCQSLTISVL